MNRKEPKNHLGRKRGFDFECKGRILAHGVFPLRTRFLRGRNQMVRRSIDRRGVSRHAKPLIIAATRRGRFCGNAITANAARLPGKPVFPETLSALRGGRRGHDFAGPSKSACPAGLLVGAAFYRAQTSQVRTSAAAAEREELRLNKVVGRHSVAPQKQDHARPH